MIYEYTIENPNMFGIHFDITNSEMENKIIKNTEYNGTVLNIEFDPELSAGDKTILDGIVVDSENSTDYPKPKMVLLNTILFSVVDDDQKNRLLIALNNFPNFSQSLEDGSYAFARQIMNMALIEAFIVQADYDLIDSILPTKGLN